MAKSNNTKDFVKDIADVLRDKTKTTNKINPQNFTTIINSMKVGDYNIIQKITGDECELEIYNASEDGANIRYLYEVLDFDGRVLLSNRYKAGDVVEIPEQPVHEGLTFVGWNCIDDLILEDGEYHMPAYSVSLGATYTNNDEYSEFDIELVKPQTITFTLTGEKDWGDGTRDSATSHAYAASGKYTIRWRGTVISGPSLDDHNIFGGTAQEWFMLCKAIRIGSVVSEISYDAFSWMDGYEYVFFPTTLQSITGYNQFNNLTPLKTLILHKGLSCEYSPFAERVSASVSFLRRTGYETVTISKHTTKIWELRSLSDEITMPNSVTMIDYIRDCENAETIYLSSALTTIKSISNCRSLKYITFPDSLTTMNTVSGVPFLRAISLPDNLTKLKTNAFVSLHALEFIKYPANLTTIPISCVDDCIKLTDVILPEKLITIGDSAFFGCNSLRKMVFPSTLEQIEYGAFSGCNRLELLDFSACTTIPTITTLGLTTKSTCKIIVPDDLYDQWIVASGWSDYSSNIFKKSEVR